MSELFELGGAGGGGRGGGVWAGVTLDSTVNNMLVSPQRSLIHKNFIKPKNCKFSSCFCKRLHRNVQKSKILFED
jgi:hypothetical protein